jgi:asparagine synthetase B (glutamine-hydrolysing)
VNLALAIGLAHANGPRVVVGQGADELFYGYAHFRGLPSVAARERARIDWEMLVAHEWPRAERMARSIGLELRSPFLDSRVVELARESDPPAADEPPKIALRRTAALLGLPALLVDAPKRALQYGSGVHRLARRMDGTRGVKTRDLGPVSPD